MGPKKSIILTGISYYPIYHLIRIWSRNNNRDKEGENRDRKKISYYPEYRIKWVSSYPDSTVLRYRYSVLSYFAFFKCSALKVKREIYDMLNFGGLE